MLKVYALCHTFQRIVHWFSFCKSNTSIFSLITLKKNWVKGFKNFTFFWHYSWILAPFHYMKTINTHTSKILQFFLLSTLSSPKPSSYFIFVSFSFPIGQTQTKRTQRTCNHYLNYIIKTMNAWSIHRKCLY